MNDHPSLRPPFAPPPNLPEDCPVSLSPPTELDEMKANLDEVKSNYEGACKTIAEMHAAAVGEVTGPRRGVVEDVHDVRSELLNLRARVIYLGLELEASQMTEANWRLLAQARHKPAADDLDFKEFMEQERRRFMHTQSFVL